MSFIQEGTSGPIRSPPSPLVPRSDSFSLWEALLEDCSFSHASAVLVYEDRLHGCRVSEQLRNGRGTPSQWPLSRHLQHSVFLDLPETLQQVNGWKQPCFAPVLPTSSFPTSSFLLLRRVFGSPHWATMWVLAVSSEKRDRNP